MGQNQTADIIRFGPFELSVEAQELRKYGTPLNLSGQPIQVLILLTACPGKLITREELRRKLWQGNSFGDFDHGLNAAVNRLREKLGDSATAPRYIETLQGRGYRFIAEVQSPSDRPTPGTVDERPGGVRRHKGALALMLVVLAALIAGLGIYLSRLNEHRNPWNLQGMKITRVTQRGNAANVAVSPDGRFVAYVLREGEKQSLNVRQVATGSDVQILPPDEVWIWSLTFTPDANYIDFVRSEKPNFADTYLYRMPVLGGTPHLAMQGGIDFDSSYSPDGAEFAFLRYMSSEKIGVWIAKADGSDQRVLASPPYIEGGATGIAWSPDGKTIALTTSEATKGVRSVLSAISVADGSVREIYSTRDVVGRPRWLPDGSGLLAPISNVDQAFRGQLWFISYPKGEARRLTNDLMDYQLCCLDLMPDGKALVDTELTTVSDLWIASAGNRTKAKQITTKEFAVGGFSWMPDGRIILANQDGNLYAINQDGSGRTRLTPDDSPSWDPSVCGDGRYIVYAAYREQKRGIWRMNADGSNPIRIADETFAISPECSPDGKWVVYLKGPCFAPVRVNITGEKPPETLSQDCALGSSASIYISPDGKRIAYLVGPNVPDETPASPSTSKPNQLKVIPFDGGVALYQVDWPLSAKAARWAPAGDAVEYASTRNGVSNIWRQKLEGGPPKQITNFESGQIFDFAWSHDGRQLALTRGSESSDVILISNFR
jgi:Tol biopolymer transport system component/DNA-binding winged helix-turn-helix (wHTH) protein